MLTNKAIEFMKERGYTSISDFARAIGEDVTNTHKVFSGKQKPGIEKCFKYANALGATIDQILMLFYTDLMNDHIKNYNNALIDLEMQKLYQEEAEAEKKRHESPCCENCMNCYIDYGMICCKKHDEIPEDFDISKDKCDDWR